jgi:phage baseplate assembly protein W
MGFPPLWNAAGAVMAPPVLPTALAPPTPGTDIWFDVASPVGADRMLTTAGDWRMTRGDEALRQSLLRRLMTTPGEWRTVPSYGCGAPLYVNARNSKAARAELANRIRAQFLRDDRVVRVALVVIEDDLELGAMRIRIDVVPRSRPARSSPLTLVVVLS